MTVVASSTETLGMVAAALSAEDKFAAGKLLGRATLERVKLSGQHSIISETHRAIQVVSAPHRDELEEGFAKEIFFGLYVDQAAFRQKDLAA